MSTDNHVILGLNKKYVGHLLFSFRVEWPGMNERCFAVFMKFYAVNVSFRCVP